MKICLPGQSFKALANKKLLAEALSIELSSDYYTVTEFDTWNEATIIDRFTIQLADGAETFEVGDPIKLKLDGFIKENRVSEVAEGVLRLSKEIASDVATVEVKKNFVLYEIKADCPQNYYFFDTLELVIIKSAFQQCQVSFSTIMTRNKNLVSLFEEADYVGYNEEALNSVFADLTHIPKFWNVVDSSQFRELIIRKILAIAESNHLDNSTKFLDQYNAYLGKVENKISVKGEISEEQEISVEQDTKRAYEFRLGG